MLGRPNSRKFDSIDHGPGAGRMRSTGRQDDLVECTHWHPKLKYPAAEPEEKIDTRGPECPKRFDRTLKHSCVLIAALWLGRQEVRNEGYSFDLHRFVQQAEQMN